MLGLHLMLAPLAFCFMGGEWPWLHPPKHIFLPFSAESARCSHFSFLCFFLAAAAAGAEFTLLGPMLSGARVSLVIEFLAKLLL